ncbi:unnamed protein product [Medioppia subpectinata]|uniref:Proteasomal ubiquitin receptor ADRM1 homolog n=1 Tax=Medioppia subpectinata TaxID=1979941 RepID=A0A7R9KE44_9ACAR|nr:unnamed protein product [Medioppia subpectinata]CAG2100608.1 unnamed protein product [Medioppia subpectinata]
MSRTALFRAQRPAGAQTRDPNDQYLVHFKAGKMIRTGTTVSPVKNRKGLVYLHQSDDSLLHFCWKDRETGALEDDLILFPEEAEFKRVVQCTTGRVFVLKFKSNPNRYFYWSQEPNSRADKDDELVAKFNQYMGHRPAPAAASGGTGAAAAAPATAGSGGAVPINDLPTHDEVRAALEGMPEREVQALLAALDSPSAESVVHIERLLARVEANRAARQTSGTSTHGTAPAAGGQPTAANGSATNGSQIQVSQLQSAINNANRQPFTTQSTAPVEHASPPAVANASTATGSQVQAPQSRQTPGASAHGKAATGGHQSPPAVAKGSAANRSRIELSQLRSAIDDANRQPSATQSTAPVGQPSSDNPPLDELRPLLSDVAFMRRVRQTLPAGTSSGLSPANDLSAAIRSRQLGPVVQEFNLGQECVAAANAGDVENFVNAYKKLRNTSKKSKSTDSKKSEPKAKKKD